MKTERIVRCQLTGKELPMDEVIPADLVRDSLLKECKKLCKEWDPNGYVSLDELNRLRMEHVEALLVHDASEVHSLNRDVAKSLRDQEILTQNVDQMFEKQLTFGERLSDKIAAFGGSWPFIISFLLFLLFWIGVNLVLRNHAFDAYPFIFLNLVLSCIAALQAPVIMMSQNRQEERDRARGENDYKINLKAELEIHHLHEKLDKLVQDQWKHLLEIQQMQMDMIEEMSRKKA